MLEQEQGYNPESQNIDINEDNVKDVNIEDELKELEKDIKLIQKRMISKTKELNNHDIIYNQKLEDLKREKIETKRILTKEVSKLKRDFKEKSTLLISKNLKYLSEI